MKRKIFFITLIFFISVTACQKDQFGDAYEDPSSVGTTTVEKQYSGALASTLEFTMYRYWNYFVVLQNTSLHYSQAVSWANFPKQYEPGAAAITDRWAWYYGFLAQYKELLKVYNTTSAEAQLEKRIYYITSTIYFYDHTQQMVDLHGDIPWSEAGLLSTNGGDYQASYPKYDDAATIYTTMLDDLKQFSEDLNAITVPDGVKGVFKTQDFINAGDVTLWKKYCNSLRVRMLMRVSDVPAFQSRAASELAAIVGNPSSYPVCTTNDDNILIDVVSLSTSISSDLYSGLSGWGNNDIATKVMIDTMQNNGDPRLRAIFQPGDSAAGVYYGLNQMLDATTQGKLQSSGKLARYNYTTISKNHFLPGIIMTAAETQLLLADYYLNSANDAAAKAAYERGINTSIDFYYYLYSKSDNSERTVAPTSAAEKTAYLASRMAWAGTTAQKENLIALQKWINYNALKPLENWAEIRRTKLPVLNFEVDNASSLASQPPARLTYSDNEKSLNTANYDEVRDNDKLDTKIFWDVK